MSTKWPNSQRAQVGIPAVFMRGGTSKGVFFHARDLPIDLAEREQVFLTAMGSPDPYGRQLDGMGGGVSSLSKVVIVSPSPRVDADIDYNFGQVAVGDPFIDWASTCGNLASAVGPFAVDEGLMDVGSDEAAIRIHAVNTGKLIHACFPLVNRSAAVRGTLALPGVAGAGAAVRLTFLDPGGSATGRLLPSDSVLDTLDVPGFGQVNASLVDAAAACVFVAAADFGLSGLESPAELENDRKAMDALELVRCLAGVKMGLKKHIDEIRNFSPGTPKVAIVAGPGDATLIDGRSVRAHEMDVSVRMLSMRQAHRAVPLTGALCLAVAARITGTLVAQLAHIDAQDIRVGTPSGIIPVTADVSKSTDWVARSAVVYRTARKLMAGEVFIPR